MIFNIRGTSGSGKSTIVRQIMAHYRTKAAVYEKGRKRPIGYILTRPDHRPLAVVGHYETPCGGCDTIASQDHIMELVDRAARQGMDVIFEGLLISADARRPKQLMDMGHEILVIGLTTDVETCLASVNKRRWEKNPDKPPVNPKNTLSKYRGVETSIARLAEAGVPTTWANREDAKQLILDRLSVKEQEE